MYIARRNTEHTDLDDLSLDLIRPACVVLDGLRCERDIDVLRPGEGLAVVEGLERGELILVLVHEVTELP